MNVALFSFEVVKKGEGADLFILITLFHFCVDSLMIFSVRVSKILRTSQFHGLHEIFLAGYSILLFFHRWTDAKAMVRCGVDSVLWQKVADIPDKGIC
jgi:hypothetical protein